MYSLFLAEKYLEKCMKIDVKGYLNTRTRLQDDLYMISETWLEVTLHN